MRQVFISSTGLDLKAYREAARDVCLSMGFQPVMMEYFEAMSAGATEGSITELGRCDLYVGIYAHRYGYCEPGYNKKSVTEIEFDTAGDPLGLDRLCFVVKDNHPWPTDAIEFGTGTKKKMDALKKKVKAFIVAFFTTVDDFRAHFTASLSKWKDKHPETGGGLGAVLAKEPADLFERPDKLIGRAQMLKEGLKALKGDQPLLLHGFAGMGKTALAAELAARWIEKNEQPALWLKVGSQPFEVCAEALARPFGAQIAVASAQGDDKIATLHSVLKSSGAGLIVLDDAWNGAALGELVKAVPHEAAVMVTSRRRYPVGAVIEVGQLPEPDALALLAYHTDKNTAKDAKAQELVRLLGYHAFSVEVAGRTMKTRKWTPAEMMAQIKDSPHEAALPADYGEENRHSVKELLDTSVNALLDEKAKRVFLAFGALFSPQATAEMLGLLAGIATKEAANALVMLDDHGLAERIPAEGNHHVAYYRIHDMAASYARAQATDEQRAAAVDACLQYLSRYLEPGHTSFAALRPEMDNLLGAAGRALALGRPEDCEEFAWGLYRGSQVLDLQGYSTQAVTLLGQAIEAARLRGDRRDEGAHLTHLGLAHADLGQVEKAIGFYEQALAIHRKIGDRRGEGVDLNNLGLAYADLGQVEKAIGFYEQKLVIVREIGDRLGEGNALGNLGIAYANLGQVEKAIGFYEHQLVIVREIGDQRGEGNALNNLGIAYRNLGQVEKAIDFYEQALAIDREIGDRMGEGNALNNLGVAYESRGEFDRALEYFWQAWAIRVEIGAQHRVKQTDDNIADVEAKIKGGDSG